MSVTGTTGFRDGAFQSGCGMCKPSTDYTGGMPKRYFSPSAKLYKNGGDSTAKDITSKLNGTTQKQGQLSSIAAQTGGGSDWMASHNSRSLQPMEFQWTNMKDFQAFTKTPYISPKSLVSDIMPPSAEASTHPASGFDPAASDYGLVGGKKKRKTKKKTTKRKTTKKTTKRKTTKKTTKRKTTKKVTKKKKVPATKTKAYKAADKQEKKAKKDIKKLKSDLKKVEKKIKVAEKKKKAATTKRKKVSKK